MSRLAKLPNAPTQGIPEPHARRGPGLAFLRKHERVILTQRRGVDLQRLVPTLLRLEALATRAHRREAALAGGRIDPPQALQGLDPVGTEAPRPRESGARLLEAARAECRETFARRLGITVIAGGGARPGEPHAGLRIVRIERQRLRVVLRRARVLAFGLRVFGVREQRQNARQASRAALPERGARVLRIDARRQIEALGRQLLLAGAERAIARGELRGERRRRCAFDRLEQPRGLREALLRERHATGVVGANGLGGARLGRGEVSAAPDTRAARLERSEPAIEARTVRREPRGRVGRPRWRRGRRGGR